MKTIGNRLVEARTNCGLSLECAAEKIDVGTAVLSQWEKDEMLPDVKKLSELAKLYQVTADWLIDGTHATENVLKVTKELSDRIFDENRMYTYLRGNLSARKMYQSLHILPYIKEKHEGQKRKGKDQVPYFSHPLQLAAHALALGLEDDDMIATALLHDICEDCNVSPDDLPASEQVIRSVTLLTKVDFPEKKKNLTDEEKLIYQAEKKNAEDRYYQRLRTDKNAVMVKLLDRCHNLSGMATAWKADKLASYILETQEYIYPLMEYAKNSFPEYDNQIYLVKYHIRSVVETIRHMLVLGEAPF